MRWIIIPAILYSLLSAHAEEATIEIGDLQIAIGMLESDVRYAFPKIHCEENAPGADKSIVKCFVGDGVAPENDGHISFVGGRVQSATRYWHVPKESGPYEVLMFVNNILQRMAAESSTCTEIGSHEFVEDWPNVTSITFYFPEKSLTMQTQKPGAPWPGEFFIHEYLRQNPVPTSYEVRQNMNGTKRCALVE